VSPERSDDRPLDPAALEVDLEADAGEPLGAERKGVVERDEAGVAQAATIVRDDERAVGQ
jgi:hypothetical protein